MGCCDVLFQLVFAQSYLQGTASSWGFSPRGGLASVAYNGKIYVLGGENGGNILNLLEVYDPLTNTWNTPVTTGTFTARTGLAAAVVSGKIYAFGGIGRTGTTLNTLEVFDIATNT